MNEISKVEMSAELAADIGSIRLTVALVEVNCVVGLGMVALLKSVNGHTIVQTLAQYRAEIIFLGTGHLKESDMLSICRYVSILILAGCLIAVIYDKSLDKSFFSDLTAVAAVHSIVHCQITGVCLQKSYLSR